MANHLSIPQTLTTNFYSTKTRLKKKKKQKQKLCSHISQGYTITTLHLHRHSWTKPWGPNFFFKKNIIIYMGTNFSNFVLENYTFDPLKILLILLRVLL